MITLLLDHCRCGSERKWRGEGQPTSWAAHLGAGEGTDSCLAQSQGTCISTCSYHPNLSHVHKVTKPNSSSKSEDTWDSEADTASEGCLGFGIMLRSPWHFSTLSNQEKVSLQAPASSHHRLPGLEGVIHVCACSPAPSSCLCSCHDSFTFH